MLTHVFSLKRSSDPTQTSYSIYDEYVAIHLGVIGLFTTAMRMTTFVNGAFEGNTVPDFSGLPSGTFPSGPAEGVNGAHGGPAFLPWHREYLLRFENELREIDSQVAIPYWDWTDHAGTRDLFTDDLVQAVLLAAATSPSLQAS